MPILDVTTKDAKQVWQSPDGQRTIYEVVFDYQGQPMKAKTYSGAIAQVNWTGQIETSEKVGRNGSETFVKQAPKEGFTPNQGGGGQRGPARTQDSYTMYLSYAKDIVVALMETSGFEKAKYEEALEAVIYGGNTLYANRPDAQKDAVAAVPEGPIDTSMIDKVFGEPESPWKA